MTTMYSEKIGDEAASSKFEDDRQLSRFVLHPFQICRTTIEQASFEHRHGGSRRSSNWLVP